MDPGAPGTTVRHCPACASREHHFFLRKESLSLVQCHACSMIFAANAAPEFKEAKFYQTTGSTFYASDDKLAGDYSPVRYEREIKILRKHCRGGRILDVGCSTGGFLYYLRERFPDDYQVAGTDVAMGALEIAASKGIPVIRENLFSLSPSNGVFDAITFWAVLEHVEEPLEFLQKAGELLDPNGRLFVLVPNMNSLAVKILGAKYRYILPQHLNYFSTTTLSQLGERAGFATIQLSTTHFNPLVILQDLRSGKKTVADADRAKLLVKTNRMKTSPALAPLRWCYTTIERALGAVHLADNIVLVLAKRR